MAWEIEGRSRGGLVLATALVTALATALAIEARRHSHRSEMRPRGGSARHRGAASISSRKRTGKRCMQDTRGCCAEPIVRSGKWCLPYARGHGEPRRPRSGCGRVLPPPEMRARRLRMPVIRPVWCVPQSRREYRDDDYDTVAAGSVETRVTTTWTHGMTSGAETVSRKRREPRRRGARVTYVRIACPHARGGTER